MPTRLNSTCTCVCVHVSCDFRLQLFCVSLPLGPLIALCVHLTDMRVDARRMLWWDRRPVAVIAQDIGTRLYELGLCGFSLSSIRFICTIEVF